MSGDGMARGYSWHEEAFELEVSVTVPKDTRAKDIIFQATPTSIDLRLCRQSEDNESSVVVLLDPTRKLRGRVSLEGTFWILSDPENDDKSHRQVTVTIEKQIRSPKDDFDVIDYDWKGLYLQEEEDEISFRKYDEAEALDVREYAASLGVDIDNINMSLVDKNMFTSGLNNLTRSSLDSMKDAGLMTEVTRQSDGSEWTTDANGERVPFHSMGERTAAQSTPPPYGTKPTIPFLDTSSPWHNAIPVDEIEDQTVRNEDDPTAFDANRKATAEPSQQQEERKQQQQQQQHREKLLAAAADPIATLTIARLKEILKSRGLKVSGNKKELQDRLRSEVSSMMDPTADEHHHQPDNKIPEENSR